MTSIGNAEYPEISISESVEVIEGIKREKAQTTAALGKVMGLTNVSTGFFYNKAAALSKFYGLIERQKTNVTLTPLAKRIVYPVTPTDREAALYEVAARVPLLSNLFQALGPEFHQLDFPTKLLEITGASHEEIEAKGPKVEKLYRDALQYLRPGMRGGLSSVAPTGPMIGENNLRESESQTKLRPDQENRRSTEPGWWIAESDGMSLRIRRDPEALEDAIATIKGWMTRHRKSGKK